MHRQVKREHAVAEHALADRHDLVEVGAMVVELGDDHGAWHADSRALLPEHLGRAVDAISGGNNEQRRIRGAQAGPQIPDEVGVTGCVDEVDLDAVVLEGRERKRDGPLLAQLGLVEVA